MRKVMFVLLIPRTAAGALAPNDGQAAGKNTRVETMKLGYGREKLRSALWASFSRHVGREFAVCGHAGL